MFKMSLNELPKEKVLVALMDVIKQKEEYIFKDEPSSPTVLKPAFMASCPVYILTLTEYLKSMIFSKFYDFIVCFSGIEVTLLFLSLVPLLSAYTGVAILILTTI